MWLAVLSDEEEGGEQRRSGIEENVDIFVRVVFIQKGDGKVGSSLDSCIVLQYILLLYLLFSTLKSLLTGPWATFAVPALRHDKLSHVFFPPQTRHSPIPLFLPSFPKPLVSLPLIPNPHKETLPLS